MKMKKDINYDNSIREEIEEPQAEPLAVDELTEAIEDLTEAIKNETKEGEA